MPQSTKCTGNLSIHFLKDMHLACFLPTNLFCPTQPLKVAGQESSRGFAVARDALAALKREEEMVTIAAAAAHSCRSASPPSAAVFAHPPTRHHHEQ